MIRTILADIDNTLLDFDACARWAMRAAFGEAGLAYEERMFPVFQEISGAMWREIETGALTREELHRTRWNAVFSALDIRCDGEAFESRFHALLAESHVPVPGARETLAYLAGKYAVCAASNAPCGQQRRRLTEAGLLPYFTRLFTSEQLGFTKPDPRFFNACLRALGESDPRGVLLLGDSQTADIRGGAACGLMTCWFNRYGETPLPDVRPDYTVARLEEVRRFL